MNSGGLTLELVDAERLPQPMCALAARVAEASAAAAGLQGTVALRICGDAEMRRLNRQFRNVDQPTDVLAFPPDAAASSADLETIGDVALSYERAISQGREYGHGLEREFAYLITHALLHLAGFRHDQAPDYRDMRQLEERILGSIGLMRDHTSAA